MRRMGEFSELYFVWVMFKKQYECYEWTNETNFHLFILDLFVRNY